MNFQHWLYMAVNFLTESENPYRDAEILLEFVTKKPRTFLFAFSETFLTIKEEKQLFTLLLRRKMGEPIAYLIKEHEFWSLPLYVSEATLIPRSDTECLVEQALIRLPVGKSVRILDLGTGTGAIALAIASERPDCDIIAVDLIPDAVMLASRNTKRLSINNVHILKSYWFNALIGQKFEMILSNPPYIDFQDPHLLKNIRFEPLTALVSPNKGIADLEYIILNAREHLVLGGWLLVEHAWNQGKAIFSLFSQEGFQDIRIYRDYGGNERLTVGKKL